MIDRLEELETVVKEWQKGNISTFQCFELVHRILTIEERSLVVVG